MATLRELRKSLAPYESYPLQSLLTRVGGQARAEDGGD